MGVVAPPNWTNVSLRTTHNWQIKFKQANEKHSSKQALHSPIILVACSDYFIIPNRCLLSSVTDCDSVLKLLNLFARMLQKVDPRGAGRSIIGGAHIHIFVFTDCKNN